MTKEDERTWGRRLLDDPEKKNRERANYENILIIYSELLNIKAMLENLTEAKND